MYKVRFHLAKGKDYKKWQVVFPDGSKHYYSPQEYTLILTDCKTRIQRAAATRIYNGANREVCAWVDCKNIDIKKCDFSQETLDRYLYQSEELAFSPKDCIDWTSSIHDRPINNTEYARIETYSKLLFNS